MNALIVGTRRALAILALGLMLLPLLVVPAFAGGASGEWGAQDGSPMAAWESAKAIEDAAQEQANNSFIPGDKEAAQQRFLEAQQAAKVAYDNLSQSEKNAVFNRSAAVGTLSPVVRSVIPVLFGLACSLAVLNVVWQGFKLMGGNPSAAQSAKASIVKSFLGLATILGAWGIVGLVVRMLSGLR